MNEEELPLYCGEPLVLAIGYLLLQSLDLTVNVTHDDTDLAMNPGELGLVMPVPIMFSEPALKGLLVVSSLPLYIFLT